MARCPAHVPGAAVPTWPISRDAAGTHRGNLSDRRVGGRPSSRLQVDDYEFGLRELAGQSVEGTLHHVEARFNGDMGG